MRKGARRVGRRVQGGGLKMKRKQKTLNDGYRLLRKKQPKHEYCAPHTYCTALYRRARCYGCDCCTASVRRRTFSAARAGLSFLCGDPDLAYLPRAEAVE